MSDSIRNSNGVSMSDGVNGSYGVNRSDGVNGSYGVNRSYGVSMSDGVNGSYGVNRSDGVNGSYGVNRSYGVINSFGVDKHIFCADKKRTYAIFKTEVSEERFQKVWNELLKKLNGWFPKFNTAYLWLKKEGEWRKVDASKIEDTLDDWEKPYEAWKDMPQEAIDYIRSLPEYDEDIFVRVTGIKQGNRDEKPKEIVVGGATYVLKN